MRFDFVNLDKLRRGILYGLLLMLFLLLQNVVFSRITVLGVRCFFLPVLVLGVGLFEGGIWGGVFGLCAGILSDLAGAAAGVTFTVLFSTLGFFTGLLAQFLLNRRFFSYFVLCLLALALTAFCQFFPLLVFQDAPWRTLLRTALLQLLWSLPFSVPAYFACRALSARHFD